MTYSITPTESKKVIKSRKNQINRHRVSFFGGVLKKPL